jgi:hypothetical protein
MNDEELKRLLGKYYEGESTEAEETVLRDYFRSGKIPEGYEAEREIFGYYTDSSEIPEPSHDFEAQILAAIDASERNKVSPAMKKILFTILSAAAGLLILGGSYFFFISRTDKSDTFSDPEIAYAETVKVLREVSLKLNRGTQVLEPIGRLDEITRKSFTEINMTTSVVAKNLRQLNKLNKAVEDQHFPDNKKINK